MIRNFFKTAWRSMLKNKAYALINLIGLTCGLTLALLIITYVRSELNYDRFHTKLDRIYRIKYVAPNGLELATSPPPIAPRMAEFFPEVEKAGRMYRRNASITRPGSDEVFEETAVFFADSAITDILTLEFVRGNPKKPLHEKFTVLITEEMATKYFGESNPIGEQLVFGGRHAFTVVGVVKRYPDESHITFNMLVPYDNMFDIEPDQTAQVLRNNLDVNFIISHSYTYVLLKPGADPVNVDNRFGEFLKRYALPNLQVGQVFSLMPISDIHLSSTLLAEPSATNSMTTIYIFIGIGVLTLVIASINYINLSTAQSFTRIKEIGIRKVLGSMKVQLIAQFLAESFLFCMMAIGLALVVLYFTLPLLNLLTGKQLMFSNVMDNTMIGAIGGLVVVIAGLAGGYPSYFVTQFNSIDSLKGSGITEHGSRFLRNSLVVFQLTIASMLLCASLVIIRQMNYLTNRSLGFEREHVVNIPLFSQNMNGLFRQSDSTFRNRLQTFRDVVEQQSGIAGTALSSNTPGMGAIYNGAIPEGFTAEDNLFVASLSVDHDFLNTYGMQVVAGRSFSRDFGDERESFIVNEMAVQEFNWGTAEEAIGRQMTHNGRDGKIVGVIKDFNFTALTVPISAIILHVSPNGYNTLSVKFQHDDVQRTLDVLEKEWNRMFPEKGFQYTFLDQQLNTQYQNYDNFSTIIQTFTFIAILISCLGVYGLVLFVVQRKVKEIGVRKVLGASVSNILTLIYKDFAILLAIGFVLSVPVSYYFLDQWMDNFTYKTSIGVLSYAASFVVILVVVASTIGYHAIKASLSNPVSALRSE